MADQVEGVELLNHVPGAANLKRPKSPVAEMKAFQEGRFAIQDGAAQLVSLLLSPEPGETVLDACAGLGGKTTHIAQLMKNRGSVIAIDHMAKKLSQLEIEAKRLAISIIRTLPLNIDQPIDENLLPRFDRILLDAPCTGLGVLRRNPDAKWSAGKKDRYRYADRQQRLLDHLAPMLKTGGTLVYSVCSMEPEETEDVVLRFLKNHPNFVIKKEHALEEKAVAPFLTPKGHLRTDPYLHGLDGFFAVRLCREA
jgi:16S rRNA (cytosine967-C5)-methyltransferase